MTQYLDESIALNSYMCELHRAIIQSTRHGHMAGTIELRKKLARAADKYRHITSNQ